MQSLKNVELRLVAMDKYLMRPNAIQFSRRYFWLQVRGVLVMRLMRFCSVVFSSFSISLKYWLRIEMTFDDNRWSIMWPRYLYVLTFGTWLSGMGVPI